MTIAEVEQYLQVSRWSVKRLIEAGHLEATKADGRNGAVRIYPASLRAYVESHTVTAKEE
ncbi:hypothetical protein GCM10009779_71930 [Polymorphospora rubra]